MPLHRPNRARLRRSVEHDALEAAEPLHLLHDILTQLTERARVLHLPERQPQRLICDAVGCGGGTPLQLEDGCATGAVDDAIEELATGPNEQRVQLLATLLKQGVPHLTRRGGLDQIAEGETEHVRGGDAQVRFHIFADLRDGKGSFLDDQQRAVRLNGAGDMDGLALTACQINGRRGLVAHWASAWHLTQPARVWKVSHAD